MNSEIEQIISTLKLIPHPEGGYYRETYRSSMQITPPSVLAERPAVTDIYYLLVHGEVSRFHRVLHDEIWHFYKGATLRIAEIFEEPQNLTFTEIGTNAPFNFKHCVRAGTWQAAETTGSYSLVGCTVAPGFDFDDFELITHDNPSAKYAVSRNPLTAKFIQEPII